MKNLIKNFKVDKYYHYDGKKISPIPFFCCFIVSIILFVIALIMFAYSFIKYNSSDFIISKAYIAGRLLVVALAFVTYYLSIKYKPSNILINEQISQLNKQIKNQSSVLLDEKNRVIFDVKLKKDYNFESNFSTKINPKIELELANFLESEAATFHSCQHLFLRVFWEDYDENKIKRFKEAIMNYYIKKYLQVRENIKNLFYTMLNIGTFGILFYFVSFFIFGTTGHGFISGIFEGAGMVLIWQTVHMAFIEYQEFRANEVRYLMLANMEIDSFEMIKI